MRLFLHASLFACVSSGFNKTMLASHHPSQNVLCKQNQSVKHTHTHARAHKEQPGPKQDR